MSDNNVQKDNNSNNNQTSTTSTTGNDNSSKPKSSGGGIKSLFQALVLAIVPLYFGSFLFTKWIETYKDYVSFRKSIIYEAYRPMRNIHSGCHATHNKLFKKYGEVAEAYKLMLNEAEKMLNAPLESRSSYEEMLDITIEAIDSITKDLNQLQQEYEQCKSKLFRAYEELALMTGTYSDFQAKAKNTDEKLNKLYASRQQRLQRITNRIEASELMEKIRDVLNWDEFSSEEEMERLVNEYKPIITVIIQSNFILSETEEEIFKVENEFFDNLNKTFTDDINNRFKRGFLSWL